MKKTIRLTEQDLHRIIKESVKQILKTNPDELMKNAVKESVNNDKMFSVWVGGIEVNDFYLTHHRAKDLARIYREEGYDDVHIVRNK